MAGTPVNLRIGVEGAGINSEQKKFTRASRHFGEEPDINFYRVPISAEYVIPVGEATTLYAGGGVDIIRINGAVDDTDVGGHLETRVRQNLTQKVSVSGSAGYLFANAQGNNKERFDLDTAYTGLYLDGEF
jgi:hypothetical protein